MVLCIIIIFTGCSYEGIVLITFNLQVVILSVTDLHYE